MRIRNTVLLIGAIAGFTSCLTVGEPSWDEVVTTELPDPTSGSVGLIVMVHGANASAGSWPQRYEERFRELPEAGLWDIVRIHWSPVTSRSLTAAGRGEQLGRLLGEQLARFEIGYQFVHLIGQSLGAHVIHGIAASYREELPLGAEAAVIHSTFLDPFIARSLFQPWYGRGAFGEYADFAESYFTRDEPVWFTNSPLDHAANFDVTNLVPTPESREFTHYHDYPHHYYQASIGTDPVGPGFPLSPLGLSRSGAEYDLSVLHRQLPTGAVTIVR